MLRRTTHVVDPLPERVRLVGAPGGLCDLELEVRGWTTDDASGETVVVCRLVDGSVGEIPARWTDLPRRTVGERSLGAVATPGAWRLLGERLGALRAARRPARGAAFGENGGERVWTVGARDGRAECGRGGGVGDVAATGPAGDRAGVGAPVGGPGGGGAR